MHVAGYGVEGARHRGARRRRRDHPARGPGHHPVDDGHCLASAEEAGRDPAALKCIVCAPSHISDDIEAAREQVRWFPAMVRTTRTRPDRALRRRRLGGPSWTDYVPAETGYDYDEHSRVGARHGAFVSDEICDRFCVIGTPEQAAARFSPSSTIGVDQFNIYRRRKARRRRSRSTAARSSRASPK